MALLSPYIPARTQACESLTAFCVVPNRKAPNGGVPNGRVMVLHGMGLLKRSDPHNGRFEAWIHALEKTLDGRGKMGSAVGASDDLKMTGMVGAGDSQITNYMVKYRNEMYYIYLFESAIQVIRRFTNTISYSLSV